ncbi:MAG: transporter substrate-binding domain-containing protein [Paracoccaceae bacterium]|nr:transporter substrate-binding domain-containing protein [Paracoccaceae bacterium]
MWRSFTAALALCAAPLAAQAQSCDAPYTIASGDTVFSIAENVYGDPEKWTLLYYANEDLLKAQVFQVNPGDVLFVPCEAGSQKPDATPLQQVDAEMKLVTGSDYAPFTDRSWPGQGMVTELVNAALETTPNPVSYAISWEDDWSRHLFPMLDSKEFDMGFPWLKPDCQATPDNERCANFHFSDPLVEILILLFVRQGSDFAFNSDADVIGKTLCRPKGYFTHDLDRLDRQWLSKGLVTLVQADSPVACFEALQRGEVDAVTLNVFLGAKTIDDMGLRGEVVPLDKPLSVEGLHVIISKKHWRGTTHLYRFNAGLAELKGSDRYAEIVSRHLGIFWDQIKAN